MPRPSTGEYPSDWPEIAQRVKDEAGWKCIRCGHGHDPAHGYTLTVHHLDLNKSNCRWWNLAALCQRCHLQIQGKVIVERVWLFEHSEWFKPYVAGYYAFYFGYPDERELVEKWIDELIALGQGHIDKLRAYDICPHNVLPDVYFHSDGPTQIKERVVVLRTGEPIIANAGDTPRSYICELCGMRVSEIPVV